MKRYLKFVVLILLLIILSGMSYTSFGQCPDGKCQVPQTFDYGGWRAAMNPADANRPLRAWRYVKREGHYRSVVRVMSQDRDGKNSLGSGCIIRWGKRIVIITARHVIKDARRVFIRNRLRFRACRVLGVDKKWDVAILEPDNVKGLIPVYIAPFQDQRLQIGDQVESCGYGGREDRLAANSGNLKQYLMAEKNGEYADWFELSGHARQGDSGGPVFKDGKVVGVLWGTDGRSVQATQFGRLHTILTSALGPEENVVAVDSRPVVPVDRTGLFDCQPPRIFNRPPPSPSPVAPPMVNVQADPRVGNSLASIDRKLDQVITNTAPSMEMEDEEEETKTNPALLALVVIGGVILAFVLYFKNEKGV